MKGTIGGEERKVVTTGYFRADLKDASTPSTSISFRFRCWFCFGGVVILSIQIEVHKSFPMKYIVKIMALVVALTAICISLLQTSVLPESYTWLLPLYFFVSLGCYGLLMVGVGLMRFPTCPHEAILLQQDIVEAKEFLKGKGVDVGTD